MVEYIRRGKERQATGGVLAVFDADIPPMTYKAEKSSRYSMRLVRVRIVNDSMNSEWTNVE